MQIADSEIGGARVRRIFTSRGEVMRPGRHLSADEVLSMSMNNRRALVDSGYLEVYPRSGSPGKVERFIQKIGDGQYEVIAGHKITKTPISLDEAKRLAHGKNGKS